MFPCACGSTKTHAFFVISSPGYIIIMIPITPQSCDPASPLGPSEWYSPGDAAEPKRPDITMFAMSLSEVAAS
ncbi:hypothetical protein CFIMG_002973RA [Ceratocystis fimbriata CBS 114723]|uniref:Uncharacterized protein n=1 Tax=Ceratocystis fimbriata CBS 114723 TaxID=1035309 RepID=A0A2C5WWD3_9PEZI|nr:hypothetical protein CFIMG_002973RA [Ceratocystis fimbriata CBS 114723]